jgi:hypothetical protein
LKIKNILALIIAFFAVAGIPSISLADDDESITNSWTLQNSRFGLFNALDHRSGYYNDAFPEPLLVDETGPEPEGELEFSYLHTEATGHQSDLYNAEFEKSLGVVTFELGVPYQHVTDDGETFDGVPSIDVGARSPLYQFVSDNGVFDSTFGVDMEAAIPVNSALDINTELDPGVFDDIQLGNHFTVQSVFAYSVLLGDGDNGGEQEFEYGFAFAYAIPHKDLPIPGVQTIYPLFEVSGELGLNQDESGQNSVLGDAGIRVNLKPIAGLDPSIALGYVFPMDSIARQEVRWGLVASFIIEF